MACKAAVQQDITEFSALLKNKFKKKKKESKQMDQQFKVGESQHGFCEGNSAD